MITSDDFEAHARFGKLPTTRLSPKEVEEIKALIEKNRSQNKNESVVNKTHK